MLLHSSALISSIESLSSGRVRPCGAADRPTLLSAINVHDKLVTEIHILYSFSRFIVTNAAVRWYGRTSDHAKLNSMAQRHFFFENSPTTLAIKHHLRSGPKDKVHKITKQRPGGTTNSSKGNDELYQLHICFRRIFSRGLDSIKALHCVKKK